MSSHKELDVAKGEGGEYCVCSARALFSGSEEEEERDPGEVCDFSPSRRAALGKLFHAVEDGYG